MKTGRQDRARWEDHLIYLEGLRRLLARQASQHLVVLGDFNQRRPAHREPLPVRRALDSALEGLEVATAGVVPMVEERAIDHIAHGPSLQAVALEGIPRSHENHRLSDHFGLEVQVSRRAR